MIGYDRVEGNGIVLGLWTLFYDFVSSLSLRFRLSIVFYRWAFGIGGVYRYIA
jgi:hypothetical protein